LLSAFGVNKAISITLATSCWDFSKMTTDTFEYGTVSLHDNQVTPSNVVIVNVDPKPIPADAEASLVTKGAAN
jgi:hypothetical protein